MPVCVRVYIYTHKYVFVYIHTHMSCSMNWCQDERAGFHCPIGTAQKK